jgi:hypothetical protein
VGLATRTDRPIGSPTSRFARREWERTHFAPDPIPRGADGGTSRTGSLSQPRVVGAGVRAAAGGELALRDVAGASLLVSDVTVALLLVDEARHRAVERAFGVSREQSWRVTLIALTLLAGAAHDKSDQLLRDRGGPTRSDVMLGAAALRGLLTWIPGPSSRDTPLVGTLVMVALVGAVVRPGVSRAAHGIGTSSHRARLSFNHRYGHPLPARGDQLVTRRHDDRERRGNHLMRSGRDG